MTAAMVTYTLRTSMPGRRWIGVLIPGAAAILFGLLSRGLGGDLEREFAATAGVALFGLIMPVTCLVVGDAVLGAEVRSGSFTFTWMSPVSTARIVIARWIGGSLVAGASLVFAFVASAVVGGAAAHAAGLALATAFGAATYVALFIAIGCITRRAAVWSLAFVFLVERLLGAALTGVAQLSPSHLARSAYSGLASVDSDLMRDGIPQGSAALVRLVIVSGVLLALSALRLRRLKLSGSSD